MSGRRKWSALKRQLAPEQRLRVELKMDELRAKLPPTSYAQVRWAAKEYNNGGHRYNDYYRTVYQPDFRRSLLERCSESDARRLLLFLNQWKSRSPDRLAGLLAKFLPEVVDHLGTLSDLTLDKEEIDDSAFGIAQMVFDHLTSIRYVGPTTASKILGVLNPLFFVMWDGPIQKEYFHWEKRNGRAYSIFLNEMHKSAMFIVSDARDLGIEKPAEIISKEIGQDPPFTLAKFINDYVWLTVTKKQRFTQLQQRQEHHA